MKRGDDRAIISPRNLDKGGCKSRCSTVEKKGKSFRTLHFHGCHPPLLLLLLLLLLPLPLLLLTPEGRRRLSLLELRGEWKSCTFAEKRRKWNLRWYHQARRRRRSGWRGNPLLFRRKRYIRYSQICTYVRGILFPLDQYVQCMIMQDICISGHIPSPSAPIRFPHLSATDRLSFKAGPNAPP